MTDVLTAMAEAARLAPSIHNSQPWWFSAAGDQLEVRIDPDRVTPVVDPRGRSVAIGCGAAVFNAMATARAHGRACTVALGHRPFEDVVATIQLGDPIAPTLQDLAIAAAIPHRHTIRTPFTDRAVPESVVAALREAAEDEGAWLGVVSWPEDRIDVAVLTDEAERNEQADEHYRAELAGWLRSPGAWSEDGIPADLVGVEAGRGSDLPRRQFQGLADKHAFDGAPPAVEHPLLVLVGTDRDESPDWLRAGMAMQRVWLLATSLGVSGSPSTQALDHDASRALLARLLGFAGGHPQMLLRLGFAPLEALSGPTTGRRPLGDVLVRS